jgi:hypothetical protein
MGMMIFGAASSRALVIILALMIAATMAQNLFGLATEFGALNGMAQTAVTNADGLYRIFNLLPAQYKVTVAAQGFKTTVIAPFKVDVGETITQNASLAVGSVSEQVEVTAQEQLLETTTVANSTTIDDKRGFDAFFCFVAWRTLRSESLNRQWRANS